MAMGIGALWFGEPLTVASLFEAAIIVGSCLLATMPALSRT
jgi:drug/metabolite transporter (DMT)-like permease